MGWRNIIVEHGPEAFAKAVATDASVRIVVKVALYMMAILEVLSLDAEFGKREEMGRIC